MLSKKKGSKLSSWKENLREEQRRQKKMRKKTMYDLRLFCCYFVFVILELFLKEIVICSGNF
jgi:hypothetical protein